jgi:hypothetical protein
VAFFPLKLLDDVCDLHRGRDENRLCYDAFKRHVLLDDEPEKIAQVDDADDVVDAFVVDGDPGEACGEEQLGDLPG